MAIGPLSPRARRGDPQNATFSDREEAIQRLWTFLRGIKTQTLTVYGAGAAVGRALVAESSSGRVGFSAVVPSTTLQVASTTANSTGTIVAAGAATGEWIAAAYAQCTVAGLTGTLAVTFTTTDDGGSATITALTGFSLTTAPGRAQGVVMLRCNGGGIDYTATITGGTGNPQYRLHIALTRVREA